ncbi:hypothetical protein RYX36_012668 [Vicia faba]
MRTTFALWPLLLLLFVAAIESRKDLGEHWKMVMKDKDMPEYILGMLDANTDKNLNIMKQSFKDSKENFEPRPNVSSYEDDDIGVIEKKKFVKDFEPRPNVSSYEDDDIGVIEKKKFVKDFEPRPNVSSYEDNNANNGKENKKAIKDFEPRPNLSAYGV